MIVVFFDDHCVLCNKTAVWLLKLKISKSVQFASLFGDLAKNKLPEEVLSVDSIVFWANDRAYIKSEAVLKIAKFIPGFKWLNIFKIVPRFLRDGIYDFIARNRNKWFGKQEKCSIPDTQFRNRYIEE